MKKYTSVNQIVINHRMKWKKKKTRVCVLKEKKNFQIVIYGSFVSLSHTHTHTRTPQAPAAVRRSFSDPSTNDRSIGPGNDDIHCDRLGRPEVCDLPLRASETVRPSCIPDRLPRGCTLRWGRRAERILEKKKKNREDKSRNESIFIFPDYTTACIYIYIYMYIGARI